VSDLREDRSDRTDIRQFTTSFRTYFNMFRQRHSGFDNLRRFSSARSAEIPHDRFGGPKTPVVEHKGGMRCWVF